MYNKLLRFCLLLLIILDTLVSFTQGLQFNSNDKLIAERTSYSVFKDKSEVFKDFIEFNFQLSIINSSSFGNIISIKDNENSHYYDLIYASKNDSISYLKLNLESKTTLLTISFTKVDLGHHKWHNICLKLDLKNDSIIVKVNNKSYAAYNNIVINKIQPEIFFGKHISVIDVPEMAIKNLSIQGKNKKFNFYFNEINGTDVHDSNSNTLGYVENPIWLINESYSWRFREGFLSNKVCAINFDELNQRFIILNKDSVIYYNLSDQSINKRSLFHPVMVSMRLGTNFINPQNNLFCIYEVNDIDSGKPTVSKIDLKTLTCTTSCFDQLKNQHHHHISYLDKKNNEYWIFGGFGNKRYSNEFYSLNLDNYKWRNVKFLGDFITPRFFSGLVSFVDRKFIIFGGVGNPSGDQTVGKIYYTDCYMVDLNTQKTRKLWELKDFNKKMVSGRNMILTPDSTHFYTIYYKEYIPNTYLNLYKFSIHNGEYEMLGDSIPMVSERIRTNANLYLNKITAEIYCVTQEFQLDGSSQIKIYSISNPPVSKEGFYNKPIKINSSKKITILMLFIVLLLMVILFYFYNLLQKKKVKIQGQRQQIKRVNNTSKQTLITQKNSIYIFGNFLVYDAKQRDISHMFSPKIKQLFLLILLSSDNNHVSSNDIYSALWPDKSNEKAKNSKGVTLNLLRKILIDINGVELISKNKKLFFEYKEDFYCDYLYFKNSLNKLQTENINSDKHIKKLLSVVTKGKFLCSTDSEFLDKFKMEFENDLLKVIPYQLDINFQNHNYSQAIQLAKILYHIDLTNKLAFNYELISYVRLNMTEKAKKRFNAYIIDYKKENEDDFPFTFRELIKYKSLEIIKENALF